MTEDKAMTLKEVSRRLDVSERTIMRLAESGEILGYRVGRSWRFEQADVEAYINRQRETAKQKTDE